MLSDDSPWRVNGHHAIVVSSGHSLRLLQFCSGTATITYLIMNLTVTLQSKFTLSSVYDFVIHI